MVLWIAGDGKDMHNIAEHRVRDNVHSRGPSLNCTRHNK